MATARYWRIVGLSTVGGGDLELSALHLYDGATRVGAAITPTCSHAPAAGALADLSDTDLGSVCRFAGADVRSGGFWLAWDLGSAANVTTVLPGSSASRPMFLAGAMLQSRAALTDPWGDPTALGQYPWPGASAMVTQVAGAVDDSVLRLHGDGADGSSTITDSSTFARTPSSVGSARISTDSVGSYGGAAIKFTGAPLQYAHAADLSPIGDFCIKFRLWVPSVTGSAARVVLIKATGGGHRTYGIELNTNGTVQAARSNQVPSIVGINSTSKVTASAWNWIEFNRIGTTLRLFLNGSLEATTTHGGDGYAASDPLAIGSTSDNYYPLASGGAAYIEELSITAGGGATANYTPPTGPDTGGAFGVPWQAFDTVTRAARQALAASAPVPLAQVRGSRASRMARDAEFGGAGTITGQTLVKDGGPEVPTRARVRLLRARDGVPARETWSDAATGTYSFTGLDTAQQFVALAQKPDGAYDPVAGGPLTPQVP